MGKKATCPEKMFAQVVKETKVRFPWMQSDPTAMDIVLAVNQVLHDDRPCGFMDIDSPGFLGKAIAISFYRYSIDNGLDHASATVKAEGYCSRLLRSCRRTALTRSVMVASTIVLLELADAPSPFDDEDTGISYFLNLRT